MEQSDPVIQRRRDGAILQRNPTFVDELTDGVNQGVNNVTLSWSKLCLEKCNCMDPVKVDDNHGIDENKNYISLPCQIKGPNFKTRVQEMKKEIEEEYKREGAKKQFERDGKIWRITLRYPGNVHKREMLRRIFTVLRFGGFMYRNGKGWHSWDELGVPIASAFGHGSRVMIQLPPSVDKEYDHSFWNWLVTGNKHGAVYDLVCTSTTGEDCEKEGKILFKRYGATHSIAYGGKEQIEELPNGSIKYLVETKTLGLSFRDTKILQRDQYVLYHHRHWAINLPIMGHGRHSMTGQRVSANGEHGSLYIYYMSPSKRRCGGIMIGLEGSEYGKMGQHGHKHGISGDSASFSATFGYKWANKKDLEHTIQKDYEGPIKTNGMFVDLSKGWSHLEEKAKQWKDDWVMKSVSDVVRVAEVSETKEDVATEIDTNPVDDFDIEKNGASDEEYNDIEFENVEDMIREREDDKVTPLYEQIVEETPELIQNDESNSQTTSTATIEDESSVIVQPGARKSDSKPEESFIGRKEFDSIVQRHEKEIQSIKSQLNGMDQWNRLLLCICILLAISKLFI